MNSYLAVNGADSGVTSRDVNLAEAVDSLDPSLNTVIDGCIDTYIDFDI